MKMKKSQRKETGTPASKPANYYCFLKTPIGELMLIADESALTGLYFAGRKHMPAVSKHWTLNARHPVLQQAAKELQEYFAGKRESFSVPLRLRGTFFQQRVWRQI